MNESVTRVGAKDTRRSTAEESSVESDEVEEVHKESSSSVYDEHRRNPESTHGLSGRLTTTNSSSSEDIVVDNVHEGARLKTEMSASLSTLIVMVDDFYA